MTYNIFIVVKTPRNLLRIAALLDNPHSTTTPSQHFSPVFGPTATATPPAIIVADTRKRRRSPSPKHRHRSSPPQQQPLHRLAGVRGGIMPPSAAAPFLTWSPIFVPPWGPAFLPAALYPAALRSALPGLVLCGFLYGLIKCSKVRVSPAATWEIPACMVYG